MDANFEGDIDLKNQFRIKNSTDPISIREAASKNYVDNKFNDPSIIGNTTHVDFNNKNLNIVCFIKVISIPTLAEQLTPKIFVDQAQATSDGVDESTIWRLDPDEKLEKQDSIVPNTTLTIPKTVIEVPTKSCVDKNFEDPIVIKSTVHVNFNDKNPDNVRFVKVNSMPADGEHLQQNIMWTMLFFEVYTNHHC